MVILSHENENNSQEIKKKLPAIKILVVNDGSSDRTAEIARKAGARVFSHPHNKGYGAALKTGARESSTEFVLYFDADGQFHVDDIKKLLVDLMLELT